MAISDGGRRAKNFSTSPRRSRLTKATGSPGSWRTPWAWKTPFAISNPMRSLLFSVMDGPSSWFKSTPASLAHRCRKGAATIIPAEEIARAQFWRAGTQETYRARVWVPGLASGLARDDKTSFAAHDLVVGGRLPERESPTTNKEPAVRVGISPAGWRVQIPSPRPSRGEG